MTKFCPRCGARTEEATVKVGRYSLRCECCHKEFMANECRSDVDLAGLPVPPEGCRAECTADAEGNAKIRIPRVGVTGVHYAPLIFLAMWAVVSTIAVVTANELGAIFLVPATLLCVPTAASIWGALNSLVEKQELSLGPLGLMVVKRGFLVRQRLVRLQDINAVCIRPTPPLNPLDPGRHLLHSPESTFEGAIPVPTVVLYGRSEACFGEFLSDAEKAYLVWWLKAVIMRATGRAV